MKSNREAQKALNEEHATNPVVGDYWDEMFVGVCVVIEVTNYSVTICSEKENFPNEDKWTWDLNNIRVMTREDFQKWLSYDSIPGYWADVNPGAHQWVIDYINEKENEQ